ncbi:hypothetical protein DSO57_1020281 [Entomophthora muscae]|uniref:Uncharacterized protein n=1 Tax=Entomophthora muscae TaxID=34485 RepID=A0ACC2S5U6_9FUNG|nr:hypothetical protein DSO57_1020281 [Entomophthora muscae]
MNSLLSQNPKEIFLKAKKGLAAKAYLEPVYLGTITKTMQGFKYIANSMALVSLMTAPAISFFGHAPLKGSLLVLLCGLIPSYYTHLQTNPYAIRIHIHTCANIKGLTEDQLVTIERFSYLGRPRRVVMRAGDISVINRKLTPANLKASRTVIPNSQGSFTFGPPVEFFVDKSVLDTNPLGAKLWPKSTPVTK